jgi:hypothetical protein
MIGKKLSPIFEEIEQTILEFEVNTPLPPEYTEGALRAATKIFMSVLMDKMWELQEVESMSIKDRCNMAVKAGEDIRKLVKTYTDRDTYNMF